MTDPLAHLYAVDDPELEEPPVVETSLERLTAEDGTAAEELSDSDVDELVLLLEAAVADPDRDADAFAVELDLGTIEEDGFVLNRTGHRVVSRIIERRQQAGGDDA